MRVAHVITGLDRGGAEQTLLRLVPALAERGVQSAVVSLTGPGELTEEFVRHAVEIVPLEVRGSSQLLGAVGRVRAVLRGLGVDLVQTWLVHADLIGGLAAKLASLPVVWNLRTAELVSDEKLLTRAGVRVAARLSRRIPMSIVCNSKAGMAAHGSMGYDTGRMVVIPNGIPLPTTIPSKAAARAGLGLPEGPLVARVARWAPVKGFDVLTEAFAAVAAQLPRAHFVMCGEGIDSENVMLGRLLERHGLVGRTSLLGPVKDPLWVYAAADVVVSSSWREGFPNVIAEAMAAGVPVVATAAGDTAAILAEAGSVVAVGDSAALAERTITLLKDARLREGLGRAGQSRVQRCYGVGAMAAAYSRLYEEVLAGVRH